MNIKQESNLSQTQTAPRGNEMVGCRDNFDSSGITNLLNRTDFFPTSCLHELCSSGIHFLMILFPSLISNLFSVALLEHPVTVYCTVTGK